MSTAKQRKKIGFLRKILNLTEECYRDVLAGYGVSSSKNLSEFQAEKLIIQLHKNAISTGVLKPYKYNDLAARSKKMASPKQLRMIEAMWFNISFKKTDLERKTAFEHFICKITGKQKLRFLTAVDIRKIVEALKSMKGVKNDTTSC